MATDWEQEYCGPPTPETEAFVPDRLPEDLEAERALVATLAFPGAYEGRYSSPDTHEALLQCRPEYFVKPQHRLVFEAIRRLYDTGAEINAITIRGDLERAGTFGVFGEFGFATLLEMLGGDEVSKPSVLVGILREKYGYRELIKLGWALVDAAKTQAMPLAETVSAHADAINALDRGEGDAPSEAASGYIDRMIAGEAFRPPSEHGGKLAHFGLSAFDGAIEAAPGHVIIVAARPGVGKSALAIQTQWQTAFHGIPSLLISLEMDRGALHKRYAAWQSCHPQGFYKAGAYKPDDIDEAEMSRAEADAMRFSVRPQGTPWAHIEAIIRNEVRRHGVKVVLIDHLLLLQKPNLGKNANDAACWTAISRNVKRLAQTLGICFVNLCQLNRAGEGIEPGMMNMKETGGWEEDADAVILLWPKEAKAMETVSDERAVMAKAAKVRSGPSGWKRELSFNGATCRFIENEVRFERVTSDERNPVAWA